MLNGVNHANAQNENVFNCWQVEGSKAGEATHSEFHLIFFSFPPFFSDEDGSFNDHCARYDELCYETSDFGSIRTQFWQPINRICVNKFVWMKIVTFHFEVTICQLSMIWRQNMRLKTKCYCWDSNQGPFEQSIEDIPLRPPPPPG